MVSEMYIFDLETFVWSKLPPSLDEDVPGARYFHSADVCKLISVSVGSRILTRVV